MAAFNSNILSFSKFVFRSPQLIGCGLQQVRNKWAKHLTVRDMKRRKAAKDFAVDRLRLLVIKRNDILPMELREDACKQFDERIPRMSALRQLTNRCVLTSRPRGNLPRWRISRIMWRHFVDYNQMAGIQRAMW